MHARSTFAASILLIPLALCACSDRGKPPTPTAAAVPTPAQPADPNANPLAGTVLDGQGAALQKARAVQDTLDAAAKARSDAIDAQAQ